MTHLFIFPRCALCFPVGDREAALRAAFLEVDRSVIAPEGLRELERIARDGKPLEKLGLYLDVCAILSFEWMMSRTEH